MVEVSIYNEKNKNVLSSEMKKMIADSPVYMCIGTEKVFSDSLGPRVGSLLNERMTKPLFVYGMNDRNITAENLLVLVTVSIPGDLKKMSVNLQGPIIINIDEHKACQLIVENSSYPVKFPVYDILQAAKGKAGV